MTPEYLRQFATSYLFTITVETVVLFIALSARHSWKVRLYSGVWLTACTYPVVWFVFPQFLNPTTDRTAFLWVAETFAPVAECALFWAAFVLTRPLGAVLGDLLDKPLDHGGLALSRYVASLALLAVMAGMVALVRQRPARSIAHG